MRISLSIIIGSRSSRCITSSVLCVWDLLVTLSGCWGCQLRTRNYQLAKTIKIADSWNNQWRALEKAFRGNHIASTLKYSRSPQQEQKQISELHSILKMKPSQTKAHFLTFFRRVFQNNCCSQCSALEFYEFATICFNLGLTPPPFEQYKKNCNIDAGELPLKRNLSLKSNRCISLYLCCLFTNYICVSWHPKNNIVLVMPHLLFK